jgi:hypothetical protein
MMEQSGEWWRNIHIWLYNTQEKNKLGYNKNENLGTYIRYDII